MTTRVFSFLFSLLMIILAGCGTTHKEPLRLSANLWIGYTPLFYLKERGWLKENNIELVNVVSLHENMQLYAVGNVDLFTGTQYEYHRMKSLHSELYPLMLLDRSTGGDVVMSNRSVEELRRSEQKIDAYLEVDSVNSELLRAFLKYSGIDIAKLSVYNLDPESISKLPMKENPVLIVTYAPYDLSLKQRGYKIVADSKALASRFQIFDAIYGDKAVLKKYADEINALNRLLAKALKDLRKDPKRYYTYVKHYLQQEGYEAFLDALGRIEWIYADRSQPLLAQLQRQNLSVKYLREPVR